MTSNATATTAFEGVVLDMDGTLIESTEGDFLAWQRVFADYGEALTFERYMPLLGQRSWDLVTLHLGITDEKEVKAILDRKMQYFRDVVAEKGIKTVPFAEALLKKLKSYPVKVALATSSRREKMKLVLESTGLLPYFDVIVTGDEVTNGKPAPDIFLLAAERLQIPPQKCIAVEDALSGAVAAKRAEMKCVAITTTHKAEQLEVADLVIDTYEDVDIANWFKQLQ